MKLLLTSGGLTNNTIINSLKKLVEIPLDKAKLAFIPTASTVETGDKWWLIEDLKTCKEMGFKQVDIVDISAIPAILWKPRLADADVIFVEGGNTFYLLHWFKKSGLAAELQNFLKKAVYVGSSAGSIIMTKSLILSTAEKQLLVTLGEQVDEVGLGYVDFLLVPHVNSSYFPELTFENAETYARQLQQTVYAIDNQSAVEVLDSQISVVSEGEWKKF